VRRPSPKAAAEQSEIQPAGAMLTLVVKNLCTCATFMEVYRGGASYARIRIDDCNPVILETISPRSPRTLIGEFLDSFFTANDYLSTSLVGVH